MQLNIFSAPLRSVTWNIFTIDMNLRWRIQWRPPESNVFAALYYVIYHLTHFEFTDFGVYYWLPDFYFRSQILLKLQREEKSGSRSQGIKIFSLQDLRRCMSSRLSNVWDRLKQEQQSFSDKSRAVSALNSFKKVLESISSQKDC